MASSAPIVIAGGGIGGLAAALALANVGRDVHVLERAASAATEGAGIQLGPNAVAALQRLGIDGQVGAVASVPDDLIVHDGASGGILCRVALGSTIAQRHGAPYWVVHRADLHNVLYDRAFSHPRIAIDHGRAIVGVEMDAGSVRATFNDGPALSSVAVIGADGVWSRVRDFVSPGHAPEPSGYRAYRGLMPMADAGALATNSVGAWLLPHAHVVHYPVRGGREINVVVIVRGAWAGDTWDAPASAADALAAVDGFSNGLRNALATVPRWHAWSLAKPIILPAWSRGPVALLGDAAHAMLPFFAQGGAMALEDAVELAACVGPAEGDLAPAFLRYAARRRDRVQRVQAASSANGRVFHLSGPAAFARNQTLRLMPQALLQARNDWLYGYKA